MRAFALTCEALAELDGTDTKVRCAASYLIGRPAGELAIAARFLAGTPLPPGTPSPGVGSAAIVRLVAERRGVTPRTVRRRATRSGDLGAAVAALWPPGPPTTGPPLRLPEVAETLAHLGALPPARRAAELGNLYDRAGPAEARYLTKLLLGSLRIGMQLGRVEEALAVAFQVDAEAVRRAHMLLGDIGLAAERAAAGTLDGVGLRARRPVRSMLAHPVDTPAEVLQQLEPPFLGEHKYDGVRTQLHVAAGRRHLYSRSLEASTHLFPELQDGLPGVAGEWIVDGEVVAMEGDRPLPFARLQHRLGRTQVPMTLLLDAPVVFFAFDLLRAGGTDLLDEPLERRRQLLEELPFNEVLRLATARVVDGEAAVAEVYDEALAAGHEGALFKDLSGTYRPGTRGRSWIKLKRPLGTLDVVVTAAEYGHGKRAGWLSDLTFAVRGPDGLLEVGKAYSGLTDAEIVELTERFKATTVSRDENVHVVEPEVVLEVAFGGIQRSSRHASGFALRFPRIVRRRPDLGPADADTLDDVSALHRKQARRG